MKVFDSRVWNYLRGYVIIKVRGRALERFINLAAMKGIALSGVQKIGDNLMLARVSIADYRSLRPILQKVQCKVTIEEKIGLPFALSKLRTRKMLVVGAFMFFTALYVMSSFIWSVSIQGTLTLDPSAVAHLLAQHRIRPGIPRTLVEEDYAEHLILSTFPQVAWVGVNTRGTRLVVEIVEKKLPDDPRGTVASIVADKAGIVAKLITLAGQAMVKEGDTVVPGQVLISGLVIPAGQGAAEGGETVQDGQLHPGLGTTASGAIDARGIVEARVWYEATALCPLVLHHEVPTGRKKTVRLLRFGEGGRLIGRTRAPFEDCRQEESVRKVTLGRNGTVTVELITRTYTEVTRYEERITPEAARARAVEDARRLALAELAKDARVIDRKVSVWDVTEPEPAVVARIVIETREPIGQAVRVPASEAPFAHPSQPGGGS